MIGQRYGVVAVLVVACLLGGAPGLFAESEAIWSALVYATNEPKPEKPPSELAPYAKKLSTVFGYNQLRILSEHRTPIGKGGERWLLPGKPFCLRVQNTGKPGAGGDFQLALQLYQDKRLLVQTEAQLGRKCPLFVRGPLYKKGQLVILLVVE